MMMQLTRRSVGLTNKSCSLLTRAGQSFRLSKGQARSGNEDGPLHDMPDFHFADGRPGPVTKKMEKWMWKRDNVANRRADKSKLASVVESAVTHNRLVDTLRGEAYAEARRKWALKAEVKQIIRDEITSINHVRHAITSDHQAIQNQEDQDLVEPAYYGKKLSKKQSEFLAKRVAAQQKEKKGAKVAKAEGDKKQEDADAPAKKKRVKGVQKA